MTYRLNSAQSAFAAGAMLLRITNFKPGVSGHPGRLLRRLQMKSRRDDGSSPASGARPVRSPRGYNAIQDRGYSERAAVVYLNGLVEVHHPSNLTDGQMEGPETHHRR